MHASQHGGAVQARQRPCIDPSPVSGRSHNAPACCAGFVSCWLDIDEAHQKGLVRSLEAALASPAIPPEIVTALLNLAEFMEHDERPLPLDTRTLGALAEKCHAFAKARRCRCSLAAGPALIAAFVASTCIFTERAAACACTVQMRMQA